MRVPCFLLCTLLSASAWSEALVIQRVTVMTRMARWPVFGSSKRVFHREPGLNWNHSTELEST
jgi:hypothetical protein